MSLKRADELCDNAPIFTEEEREHIRRYQPDDRAEQWGEWRKGVLRTSRMGKKADRDEWYWEYKKRLREAENA